MSEVVITAAAPMTADEQRDLLRLEGTLNRFRRLSREAGKALREIFDRQLWREYGSWRRYVEDRLELTIPSVWELRVHADICDELEAAGFQMLPASPGHSAELRPLEPEQRRQCWEMVLGKGKKRPTIATIQIAKSELLGVPVGVGDDGTISDDLAVLMKGLSPSAQAKIVRECERRARVVAKQKEKEAATEHPWLQDLKAVKVLIARFEKKGISDVTAEAISQLHSLRTTLENAMAAYYQRERYERENR